MNRIFGLCTILLAAAYLVATSQLPAATLGDPLGPKVFPYIVGALMIPTGAAILFSRSVSSGGGEEGPFVALHHQALGVVGILVWSAIYFFAFERLGYPLATAIYLFVLLFFMHPRRYWLNAATTAGYVVGSYLMFRSLGITLPVSF